MPSADIIVLYVHVYWYIVVKREEVLYRVKHERNILSTINIRKTNWIGCICAGSDFSNTFLKEI